MMILSGLLIIILCCFSKIEAVCKPNSVKQTGVTSAQQSEIVIRHNYYRKLIAQGLVPGQPKASNMKKMSWDNNLATAAQNQVTNTCTFAHVIIQDSRWFAVGQNLYMSVFSKFSTDQNWTRAVEAWYSEYRLYQYPNFIKSAGHYTQVIAANSSKVGCGYTQYYDDIKKRYSKFYACNYGPIGNIIGVPPYKVGLGCENLC